MTVVSFLLYDLTEQFLSETAPSVLDIEIYRNVTEPMHPAQGRERIHIRFRIRLGNYEGSEHLKITSFLPSLIAAWAALPVGRHQGAFFLWFPGISPACVPGEFPPPPDTW